MLELIKDIENALQCNCLRVALGMALTLPDICGQIEYPEYKVGDRYSKWCDEHLRDQGFITTRNSGDKMISGDMCYKLRCAYLHSGNLELNQRKYDDFPEFHLSMYSKNENGIYCEPIEKTLQGKCLTIYFDVRHLTHVLCNAAKEYYENHEEKTDFENHHIVIDDIEKMAEINKKIEQKVADILSSKKNINDPKELSIYAKKFLRLLDEDCEKLPRMLFDNDEDEIIDMMSAMYELLYGGFL